MELRPLYFQVDGKTDVKLVGNQPNGELVYTWKEPLKEQIDSIVTCIGLLEYQNPKLVKFLSLSGDLNIVQASISENRKYVAFVIHTSQLPGTYQSAELCGTYQAYLTAIFLEPQNISNCQTVTNCHNFFINCHFLHSLPQSEVTEIRMEKIPIEEFLIVLIHRHSIQIHKFSKELNKEVLLHITESEVLSLEFLWCQWIPQHQCLFFLKYIDSLDYAEKQIQDLSETILCWIQFYDRDEHKLMMEISASCLNLCGKYILQKQVTYMNAVNKISECKFNIHVYAVSKGDIFICCQSVQSDYIDMDEYSFSLPSRKSSNTSDTTDDSSFYTAVSSPSQSSSESIKSYAIDKDSFYSTATKTLSVNENCSSENEVCTALPSIETESMYSETSNCHQDFTKSHRKKYLREDAALYHVTVLQSCGRISVFHDKSHDLKCDTLYFFHVEGGSMIIWCPEQFAHLLDTRLCYGPNFCVVELNDGSRYLNSIMLKYCKALQVTQLSTGQCLLFVPGIACIFSIHINIERLANELSSLSLASLKNKSLDIFHYLSFHVNNTETLFQLMKILVKNPLDLQITTIFKEILLGSALAAAEYDNHQKKYLSQYLTFFIFSSFAAKTKRNAVETTSLHQKYIGEHVIYKELSVVSIATAVERTLPLQCSLWNNFCYQLKMEFATRLGKTDYFFLFLKHVMDHNRRDVKSQRKKSIINRLQQCLTYKRNGKFALEKVTEPISTSNSCCSCTFPSERRAKILDELTVELKKRFPQERHASLHRIIQSYKSHQEIQLYRIVCLTFRLFGIRYDTESICYSQLEASRKDMECLFIMLQHLQLAADELLLPLPSRFHIVQAILGFKCLNFNTFMQYVHKKIVTLCNASMEYLLKDNDESKASITKKQILICSLPREQAELLLEKWDYCWSIKHHAKNLKTDVVI